jgi:hypothetical protein
MTYQLAPLLITVTLSFTSSSNQDERFSIVWDKLVTIVQTGVGKVALVFLIQYDLPAQPTAEGSVMVAVDVPVKAILLSVDNRDDDDVTERKFVANDPLTSKLELGVMVPIPIPV